MSNEFTEVVCIRAGEKEQPLIPKAVKGSCDDCNSSVWISPSTYKNLKSEKLICLECFRAKTKGQEQIQIVVTEEGIQEVRDYLSRKHRGF